MLLAPGELGGHALGEVIHFDESEGFGDAALQVAAVAILDFETKGNVVPDVHMAEEGVALEDSVDGAQEGGSALHGLALDGEIAAAGKFKSGDQA